MAGLARSSCEDIAGYCAGDSLSDASIEDQLRQLEEQECSELDSEGSEPGGDSSEDEDDDRIEAMLVGAFSHPSTAGPSTMPSNRDSLLLLDPDFNSKLLSLASSSYHEYVLVIFWIPGSEDQSSVSSAEATSDEEVAGDGATRGRERCRGRGARRRGSSKGRGCGSRGRGSSRGCETDRGRGCGRGKGRERGRRKRHGIGMAKYSSKEKCVT